MNITKERIQEVISKSLKEGDTELDSLARFEVFMNLQNEFNIAFHFDEILELNSVGSIITKTMEKVNDTCN